MKIIGLIILTLVLTVQVNGQTNRFSYSDKYGYSFSIDLEKVPVEFDSAFFRSFINASSLQKDTTIKKANIDIWEIKKQRFSKWYSMSCWISPKGTLGINELLGGTGGFECKFHVKKKKGKFTSVAIVLRNAII